MNSVIAQDVTIVLPVILCGGSGTRLWPLSRSSFPKQFLVLSDDGSSKSLFQQAIERIQCIDDSKKICIGTTVVVTNEDHRFLVLDQLLDLKDAQATLLLEPLSKNTAPALTLAALFAKDSDSDPVLVVTSADQIIKDRFAFTKALQESILIAQTGAIAIMGIAPTAPETGYGYIKVRTNSDEKVNKIEDSSSFLVESFIEKPDLRTAQEYLNGGGYFWNAGIFILKASVWLAAIEEFNLEILTATQNAWKAKVEDDTGDFHFIRPNKDLFEIIPNQSIDCAVIEKCHIESTLNSFEIRMVPLNAGWNDLGVWNSVWQVGKQDNSGNLFRGDILCNNTKNSLIYATSRLVAATGLENLIIVETPDAVLVADRSNSQDVKNIVQQLDHQRREEKNLHRKVRRPWGWYDLIDEGEHFKVKRIQVKPGASLSLQMHHHRAEHWVVVRGTAQVTNGNKVMILEENHSTYIPQGQIHRLTNPGDEPLEIIEVQSGSYLGEDDIVRFEDDYKRD